MSEHTPDHIRENYEAFRRELPDLLQTHRGQFALMRDGKVVSFFDTPRDAYLAGQKIYPDGRISIQEVVETPVDLGFFSHALPRR